MIKFLNELLWLVIWFLIRITLENFMYPGNIFGYNWRCIKINYETIGFLVRNVKRQKTRKASLEDIERLFDNDLGRSNFKIDASFIVAVDIFIANRKKDMQLYGEDMGYLFSRSRISHKLISSEVSSKFYEAKGR